MKKLLDKWAEKRVTKNKETQEEKNQRYLEEAQIRSEQRKRHSEVIQKLQKRYVSEMEREYEKNNEPKFHVGQKVLLNHLAPGDGWHAGVRANMTHTPYDGPVEVIIKEIYLDTGWLWNEIDDLFDRDKLMNILTVDDYPAFKRIVDERLKYKDYQPVMHQYRIELENAEKQYWRYPFREFQLVAVKSEHGKALTKLYDLEVAAKEMNEAAKKAREKYDREKDKLQYLSA